MLLLKYSYIYYTIYIWNHFVLLLASVLFSVVLQKFVSYQIIKWNMSLV